MKSIKKIIGETKFKNRPKNISREFQMYGVYLAESLGDTKHYSLYIKLAKEIDRKILEEALNFTKDYYRARNKAQVFMWRLKQLDNKVFTFFAKQKRQGSSKQAVK
ncbi:MAG: hypothetical protein PHV63_02900 [Candidatus Daviesbacteria bacterium]|nr:hypothetical protein [Candidatus Daviesbacteria bacterium]